MCIRKRHDPDRFPGPQHLVTPRLPSALTNRTLEKSADNIESPSRSGTQEEECRIYSQESQVCVLVLSLPHHATLKALLFLSLNL